MKKYLWFAFFVLVYSNPIVYAREDAVSVVGYSGIWGDWGKWQYCPKGSFAAGYAMKVEAHRDGRFDDSAVNGIKLYCVNKATGKRVGVITSRVGPWGSWREGASCQGKTVLYATAMSFEPHKKDSDDTATNSVRFKCTDGKTIQAFGSMPWGRWSQYQTCPNKKIVGLKFRTAICGIQTRIEAKQGKGDDTALNGANYACCVYKQY